MCRWCAYLVLSEQQLNAEGLLRYSGDLRLSNIASRSIGKGCHNCHYVNPKLNLTKSTKQGIVYEIISGEDVPLPIEKVYSILDLLDPNAPYLRPPELAAAATTTGNVEFQKQQRESYRTYSEKFDRAAEKLNESQRRKKMLEDLGYILQSGYMPGTQPKNYIMRNMYVLPPKFRQSHIIHGSAQPHVLTAQYSDILRCIAELSAPNKTEDEIRKAKDKLTNRVRCIYALGSSTLKTGYAKNQKTLVDILQGKYGIFRRYGMGKRVGQTSRTIIDPEAVNPLGTISYPKVFTEYQSRPIRVTALNQELLQEKLQKGELVAVLPKKTLNKEDMIIGERLVAQKNTLLLQVGDEVRRPLQSGDVVLYYRAPTIWRYSILAQTIRVQDRLNFGMPLQGVSGYNADFDGDEMTAYPTQSTEGQIEAEEILHARRNIMGIRSSAPVVGPFYDTLSGVLQLTDPELKVDDKLFFNALMHLGNDVDLRTFFSRLHRHGMTYQTQQSLSDAQIMYSGRALFSATLPANFRYDGKKVLVSIKEEEVQTVDPKNPDHVTVSRKMVETYEEIKIRDGILISGRLNKEIVGIVTESLVHRIALTYDYERAGQFIDDLTNLINFTFSQLGLTVSLQDLAYRDPAVRIPILEERIRLQQESVNNPPPVVGWTADKHKLRLRRQYEREKLQSLANAKTRLESKVKATSTLENNITFTTVSGAKGNIMNQTQMKAGVGLSTLNSERLEQVMNRGERCTPYFEPGDYNDDALGYCFNSFVEGMDVASNMMHQAAGRESLLDQAMKTAKIGSLRRELIKTLENLKVQEDFTVRNGHGVIYMYGVTFDPSQMRRVGTRYGAAMSFVNAKELANSLNQQFGY